MKKISLMVSAIILLSLSANALPGLEIGVGPYVGLYSPALTTINEQVLLYDHQTAFGSAAIFGGQVKLGLPLGLGGGVDLGYWSSSKEWAEDNLDQHAYKVKLMPVDVFVQYAMPLVPMVLKAKAGVSVGNIWAGLDASQVRPNQWNHYWNSEGSAATFGIFGGLDLVALPKFNISAEIGYKMGEVDHLIIKESHEPDNVNDVLEYYDHDKDQVLPLPLEISGITAKLIATYVF
ncbi:MAG: hypothetical protein A2509_11780 [Candidatus Edwardsbacteria bacterium RIFOXYD12_FULL_50_11]|nr:MAG: hypothetical protein A2502_04270 [Candidatus Edwardsbacteria bacterium RifOxyC12_full_54_24]OGF08613.1 MAG: hypothetical protein A2273_06650 [Candidatus Edwardsbacteria bacterium RifOxyA12_full_54_48]OGF11257.1 MAG: hypothetical protein A3K15_02715 [Candidatus Edwardsbacteria bacterium GWE2_54_12]OGF16801.1 MAG: hypothetical protein A2509_11780 [Candidatus Edwardsbacteria bacterium RIFOXYD12_FULL_50_11]OGJ18071.1 MAG: hypothetical protein A2349_05105 [Candidatus Edwardsbacteria bacteriu